MVIIGVPGTTLIDIITIKTGTQVMKKVLLAVVGLTVVMPLHAQPLSERDYLSLKLPPVLTGSRLKQKRANVPASVTVIDRQMIEASGARDIPSVLRLVPGIIVGHNGDRIGVSYHGSTDYFSRRFQVLVDGRSVYTPTVGGMEWYEFPVALEDIERIEVIRGPNGATYGSLSISSPVTRRPQRAYWQEWRPAAASTVVPWCATAQSTVDTPGA